MRKVCCNWKFWYCCSVVGCTIGGWFMDRMAHLIISQSAIILLTRDKVVRIFNDIYFSTSFFCEILLIIKLLIKNPLASGFLLCEFLIADVSSISLSTSSKRIRILNRRICLSNLHLEKRLMDGRSSDVEHRITCLLSDFSSFF